MLLYAKHAGARVASTVPLDDVLKQHLKTVSTVRHSGVYTVHHRTRKFRVRNQVDRRRLIGSCAEEFALPRARGASKLPTFRAKVSRATQPRLWHQAGDIVESRKRCSCCCFCWQFCLLPRVSINFALACAAALPLSRRSTVAILLDHSIPPPFFPSSET